MRYSYNHVLSDDAVAIAAAAAKAKAVEKALANEVGLRHLDRNDDGILDYDTPGALCDLLRDTYGALPACRYVLASHLMKIWC